MAKNNMKFVFTAVVALLVSACGKGGNADGIIGTGFNITGAANKGPFVLGSSVTVSVLASDGEPTSNTLVTKTSDDLGNFSFKLDSPHVVQINVQGYHFNEITGHLSNSTLTLRAIYDASERNEQNAQVNVLTHLVNERIITHIKNGKTIDDAIMEGQSELINALEPVLKTDTLPTFTDLSVYNIHEDHRIGNAYLLALSSIVYQYAISRSKLEDSSVDSELTLLLNTLASDFGDDGMFSDPDLISRLSSAARLLRPDQIIQNLVYRSYVARGQALEAADLNIFIDTDGDGEPNVIDTDDDNDGILDIEDVDPYGVSKATVQIDKPVANKTLNGKITISGTANEFTEQVKIKIGDSPFYEAEGKANWSITLDSTQFPDGETTITVRAVQSDWGYTDKTTKVVIENIDPIVGTWDFRSGSRGRGYIIFHPSGSYDESSGYVFGTPSYAWRRESPSVITIIRSNVGPVSVTVTFSEDKNSMTLNWTSYNESVSATYEKRI